LESYDLSSLRYIMWGATPVSAHIAETVTRRTGVGWVPAYGTTELPVIACNPIEGARLDAVGRPVSGVDLRVVSLQTGEPVCPGEVGEIQARSPSLMAGYLPAEATAEASRDGWYRTGDVGWLDTGGWLRITDRLKEMIKVRGFQVAPAEIEKVLHGHPAVKDCAVFGVPDGINGEAVVAAIAASAPVDAAELADDLGPGAVQDLADESRIARLDRQIATTGWRSLRSDGASGVEVAIVAEEFGRRLIDAPFLGPILADDLAQHIDTDSAETTLTTIAVDDRAIDARGARRALMLSGSAILATDLDGGRTCADLTRAEAG